MIDFHFLKQDDFEQYNNGLFSILYENMSQIAPTGNSREEDFLFWYDANKDGLKNENRHIIISIQKDKEAYAPLSFCIIYRKRSGKSVP